MGSIFSSLSQHVLHVTAVSCVSAAEAAHALILKGRWKAQNLIYWPLATNTADFLRVFLQDLWNRCRLLSQRGRTNQTIWKTCSALIPLTHLLNSGKISKI